MKLGVPSIKDIFSGVDFRLNMLMALFVGSCILSIGLQSIYFLLIPFIVLIALWVYGDIRRLYHVLIVGIPVSTEVYLPNGLGTDVPIEQCMWLLSVIGVLLLITNWSRIKAAYILHPITLSVLAMLAWLIVTTITSQNMLQSTKYLLAKLWYVIAMFGMTLYFFKTQSHIKRAFSILFSVLLSTVCVVVIRHSAVGFTFETINSVLSPFYRNHVNYACLLAICVPYLVWYVGLNWSSLHRKLLYVLLAFVLVGLFFSYTRAAIGATFLLPIFYFIVKKRWVMPTTVAALFIVLVGVGALVSDRNYLAFAPNFAKTIHHDNFEDILSATYNFEDLSTMERVYRWVAGYNMIQDRPLLGVGASNFFQSYKQYTVSSFTTYVSDNDDRSGIHNYYLMIAVEQGLPALLIFIVTIVLFLKIGERLYHELRDPFERRLILAVMGSFFIILVISVMNDMLETDKVGTMYFIALALIVRGSILLQKQNEQSRLAE